MSKPGNLNGSCVRDPVAGGSGLRIVLRVCAAAVPFWFGCLTLLRNDSVRSWMTPGGF